MRILACDPGVHTGYAILETRPDRFIDPLEVGTKNTIKEFYEWLTLSLNSDFYKLDSIVAETFLANPGIARGGGFDRNAFPASQVFGALEYLSIVLEIDFVPQPPSIKPVGYGFLGRKYVRGAKDVHHWDALAHGMYYLVAKHSYYPNVQK